LHIPRMVSAEGTRRWLMAGGIEENIHRCVL
jgi:hypothetical protein